MLVKTGAVGNHATPAIVAVGISHTSAEAGSVILGVGVDIGSTAHIAKAKTGGLGGITHTAALERLVHTANHRVVETTAGGIVEIDAVDIGLAVLVVITTNAETHRAEVVVGSLVVGVVGSTGKGSYLLGISFLILKHRFGENHLGILLILIGCHRRSGVNIDGSQVVHAKEEFNIFDHVAISVAEYQQPVLSWIGVGDDKVAAGTRDGT